MPINFPSMHIAASVANRILNVADEVGRATPATPAAPVPVAPPVPDPAPQGEALNQQLATPIAPMPPVEAPGEPQAADAAASVASGGTVLGGFLRPTQRPE